MSGRPLLLVGVVALSNALLLGCVGAPFVAPACPVPTRTARRRYTPGQLAEVPF